jgi:transcriptional regulator with XRE-family HTH domain
MTDGEKIRALRKVLKLKQIEFAARLGINNAIISNVERGWTGLSEANIRLICLVFSVSEKWVRYGEGEIFAYTPEAREQDLREKKIIKIYRNLLPPYKELMAEFTRNLLKAQKKITKSESNKESGLKPPIKAE